jgi:hypothetical protein
MTARESDPILPPGRCRDGRDREMRSAQSTPESAPADAARSPDARRLAALLDAAMDDDHPTPPMLPPVTLAPEIDWPGCGPTMCGADVQRLWARLVVEPAIVAGPFPGLTPSRLRPLLEPGHRVLGPELLTWFDQAGLLEAPLSAAEPFRLPRALRTTDLRMITTRLSATPVRLGTIVAPPPEAMPPPAPVVSTLPEAPERETP